MWVEMQVQSLGVDQASHTPVVILREVEGERVLPIWIGAGEASAIAMRLAEMAFARPLTHDLLVSSVQALGGTVREVVISRVEDGTYFAELVLERDGEEIRVDARPSDSIAVAIRCDAPIHAHESLLELASIEVSDETVDFLSGLPEDASPESGDPPGAPRTSPPLSVGMDAEELKEYLRKMNPEDFGRFTP
jgi:uncharacterized protein